MNLLDSIISASILGHNFFILGQAGTGKSMLVRKIYGILTNAGKRVRTAASTGLASIRLPYGTTVHHLFGLLDGRYNSKQLNEKVSNDDSLYRIKETVLNTDTVIIDEVSMLSRKILEDVEDLCRHVRKNNQPFGGIQFILVGDFFQLRPVPNPEYGDHGEVVLQSLNIRKLIPHTFVLSEVYRQDEGDLIKAVNELSHGYVSPETKALLKSLQRPLPPDRGTTRLFALNYDVDKCNSDHLLDMDGDMVKFEAKDHGEERYLSRCNGVQTLYLKVGAPVILLVNLSSQLVNGLQGVVKKINHESVLVLFESLKREELISYYTFNIFSPEVQRDVATRLQIPLKLAFALTVHKSQGMSLPSVVVDCRNMKHPGQIGVAVGRGTIKSGIQILNFSESLLKRHPNYICSFYEDLGQVIEPTNGLSCCQQSVENVIPVDDNDRHTGDILHYNDHTSIHSHSVESQSDDDSDTQVADVDDNNINDINNDHSGYCQILSVHIDKLKSALNQEKYENPITENQKILNKYIDALDLSLIQDFSESLMYHIQFAFTAAIPKNGKIENKHITNFYHRVTLFIQSSTYKKLVENLFHTETLKYTHYRIAFAVIKVVREEVIQRAYNPILQESMERSRQIAADILKGSAGGRGKLRYLGGWVVAKLKHKKKKFVRRNLYKPNMKAAADKYDKEVRLFETLTETESSLLDTSSDLESLVFTKQKQNLRGGLTNISDHCFEFFICLDNKLQQLMTEHAVNIYGKNFHVYLCDSVKFDEIMYSEFKKSVQLTSNEELIKDAFSEVVEKYMIIVTAQFRRDYLSKCKVKKEEVHRKEIRLGKSNSIRRATCSKENKIVSKKRPADEKCTLPSKKKIPNMSETQSQSKQITGNPNLPVSKRQPKRIVLLPKRRFSNTIMWPCGMCGLNCTQNCVCCDLCDKWFHYTCLNVLEMILKMNGFALHVKLVIRRLND